MTPARKKGLAILLVVLFAGLTALVCWRVGLPMVRLASDPESFRQWLDQRRLGGAVLYGAMVFFQVLFAVIPGEPLEIAGGYAFGAFWGTVICLIAATLGSLLVFVLVRRFGTRLVEVFFSLEKLQKVRFLQDSPKRNVLFLVVFMIPGTPKDLLCYFAGLTDLKLSVFRGRGRPGDPELCPGGGGLCGHLPHQHRGPGVLSAHLRLACAAEGGGREKTVKKGLVTAGPFWYTIESVKKRGRGSRWFWRSLWITR